jgi:hypothetical protein
MSDLKPHKHAALIREIADHVASGAFAARHYELQGGPQATDNWQVLEPTIKLYENWDYRIVKIEHKSGIVDLFGLIAGCYDVKSRLDAARIDLCSSIERINTLCSELERLERREVK